MMDSELGGDAKDFFDERHGDAFAKDNEDDPDAVPTISDMMEYMASDLTAKGQFLYKAFSSSDFRTYISSSYFDSNFTI